LQQRVQHHHTIRCGVASATRRCNVLRCVRQIQSPTATPGLSSAVAWSKYCCTTYCRPPHPLRVGKYLTQQFAALHVSMRLGILYLPGVQRGARAVCTASTHAM
jgi:hypothetical protein